MKWTDVWKPPFHYFWGYVMSSNDVAAFSTIGFKAEQEMMAMIVRNALNDEPTGQWSDLQVKDGCDLYKGGEFMGMFRGWGHLTGTGASALNLDDETARSLQDEMIEYVMHRIGKDEEKEHHAKES